MKPNDRLATWPLKILFCLLAIVFTIPSSLQAESKYGKDLEKLRQFHKEALERAIEPVNKRYFQELETLLKRATFDGDLDTALLVRKEMQRIAPAQTGATSFVGEWEYHENGKAYRRIILSDGTAELWRNGEKWKKDANTYWWDKFTWKKTGTKIEIFSDKGDKFYIWELEGVDTIIQNELRSGKKSKFSRAKTPWRK